MLTTYIELVVNVVNETTTLLCYFNLFNPIVSHCEQIFPFNKEFV